MADNYLERQYEQYLAKKAAWEHGGRPGKATGGVARNRKVCIVTGGAYGIGRCLVETFVDKGYKVYFIDKEAEQIPVVEKALQGRQGAAYGFAGDVAEQKTLEAFATFVLEREEKIHCLIHNACLMHGGVLEGCSYEDFMYVQRVGVAAPFYLSHLFKDHFAGLGSIVNISSTRAFQSQANTESYTAAKGGITALTHALAVSLAGIARVNAVAPGWIDTGRYHGPNYHPGAATGEGLGAYYRPEYAPGDESQHPSRRIGDPLDIARTVLFLCDEQNSFINGQCLCVDGGMSKLMIYNNDYGWSYAEKHTE